MVCVYCALRADFVFIVLVNHSFKVSIKVFYTVVEGGGVGILPCSLWVGSVTCASFRMSSFLSHHFSLDLYGGHCFESLCASSSSDVEPIISCNKNFHKI
jgi:hypothetical protein